MRVAVYYYVTVLTTVCLEGASLSCNRPQSGPASVKATYNLSALGDRSILPYLSNDPPSLCPGSLQSGHRMTHTNGHKKDSTSNCRGGTKRISLLMGGTMSFRHK
jgi:hypothetical protein